MKKLFTILFPMTIGILLAASVFAQSPEQMSYQAVIRNTSNELVMDQSIGMQVSILKGGEEGTAVYVERHFPATNENGLVSLEIGIGTVISGSFNTIEWESDTYFVKVETDLNGGADYTIESTSQLLSVPYALHAKTAESVTGDIGPHSISLNIFGAYTEGDATFNDGYGRFSRISLPKTSLNSSFTMNFVVPENYTPGNGFTIRIIASGPNTGVVRLAPNSISIASITSGFIQGPSASGGLSLETIDITQAEVPLEFIGAIDSPGANINPGDIISFSYYRDPNNDADTNTGELRIHGVQILY